MSIVYSTGAVDFKAGEGGLRKMMEDMVLDIFPGTAPTTADEAPGVTRLCRCTLASGSVAATARSTPQQGKLTFTNHGAAANFKVHIHVDGDGGTDYTYTAGDTDHTLILIARRIARMLNDVAQLQAIADLAVPGVLLVQHRVAGQSFTMTDGGSSTAMTVVNAAVTAARVNTVQFGPPTAGVISKTSDVWSGVNSVSGVAGFFRFVRPNDTGILSTTDLRVQGTIATSGADLNMSNTTLTVSATTTIDTASITIPKTA